MLKLHPRLFSFPSFLGLQRCQSTNAYSSKWASPKLQQDLTNFSTTNPSPVPICLIGDSHLRRSNDPVLNLRHDFVHATKLRLHHALADFRRQHGYGRGISACQIGINLRMIALNLGYGPLTLINPKIVWHSPESITMWDDCMSIPNILVKKQRAASISIIYTDDNGDEQKWNELDVSVSELLQHEMDHLEGILNIDHPFKSENSNGEESIISMDEYQRKKACFNDQVDYTIVPTV